MTWSRFQTLLTEKRYDDAAMICERALRNSPGSLPWRLGKVCLMLGQGRAEDAILLASPLIDEPSVAAQACRLIALAHLARKEHGAALQWAKAAHARAPSEENERFVLDLSAAAKVQPAAGPSLEPAGPTERADSPFHDPAEKTVVYDLLAVNAARDAATGAQAAANPLFGDLTTPGAHGGAIQPLEDKDLLLDFDVESTQLVGPRAEAAPGLPVGLSPNVEVEARIHRMFGASLFGLWDTSTHVHTVVKPFVEARRSTVRRRTLALVALAGLGFAASAGVETIRRQRAQQQAKVEVESAQHLLETGALAQLAAEMPRIEGTLKRAGVGSEMESLRIRIDATLYRFHDADPLRREHALWLLGPGALHGVRLLSKLLLVPRVERASARGELESLLVERATDPLPPLLLGGLIERDKGKKADDAVAAYRGAVLRQPSDLANAYALLDYQLSRKAEEQARALLEEMRDVQPRSPWTQLAAARLDEEDAEAALNALDVSTWGAVPSAERHVWLAAIAIKQKDRPKAKEAAAKARALVNDQPPFLEDWADRLERADLHAVAELFERTSLQAVR